MVCSIESCNVSPGVTRAALGTCFGFVDVGISVFGNSVSHFEHHTHLLFPLLPIMVTIGDTRFVHICICPAVEKHGCRSVRKPPPIKREQGPDPPPHSDAHSSCSQHKGAQCQELRQAVTGRLHPSCSSVGVPGGA